MNYQIIIYIIFIFLIYKLLFTNNNFEHFFNFKNIPKKYNDIYENTLFSQTPVNENTLFSQAPVNEKVNENAEIPKIIHHICPNDFKKWHPFWFTCYESWLKYYPKPEYTHMHWDDKELDDFIAEEYPWFLEVFRGYDVNIKRYDISRVFLLYHFGGIYADMDYKVYKNFYNELPQNIVSIPESPYKWNEHIQNSLMISPPKQIWWLILIDEAYNRRDWNVFSATGPQLLTPMYNKHPELVNVLPFELYNPNIYEPENIDESKIYCKHLISTSWSHEDIR